MIRPLLVIALVAAIIWAVRHVRNQPPEKRRSKAIEFIIYGLIFIVIGLTVTGKLHWVAGAIAALFPFAQRFLGLAFRVLPFMSAWRKRQQNNPPPSHGGPMDKANALKLFGLEEGYSEQQVIQRHRELMQKNHPDRGGSDYLAAQINEAKEILISDLT